MKAKPFRRTPPPNLASMGESEEISRAQLVAWLADSLPRQQRESERSRRGRLSSQVSYDEAVGKISRAESGKFELREIARWAHQAWPGYFGLDRLPIRRKVSSVAKESLGLRAASPAGLPPTLALCHKEIESASAANAELRKQVTALEHTVAELRPMAEAWRAWIAKKKGKRRSS